MHDELGERPCPNAAIVAKAPSGETKAGRWRARLEGVLVPVAGTIGLAVLLLILAVIGVYDLAVPTLVLVIAVVLLWQLRSARNKPWPLPAPWWIKTIVLVMGTYKLLQVAAKAFHDLFLRLHWTGPDEFMPAILSIASIGFGFRVLADEHKLRNTIPKDERKHGYRDGYGDGAAGRTYSPNREDRPYLDGYDAVTHGHPPHYNTDDAAERQQFQEGYAAGLEDRAEEK